MTDAAGAAVLQRYHAITDHRSADLDEQYAGSLDPELRPHPYKVYPTLPPIPIPPAPDLPPIPALAAIAGLAAASSPAPMNLATLGRLCRLTNGVTRRLTVNGETFGFRAAPCTGARFHQELYLVCGDLDGLAAGVYHYDPDDDAVRQLRAGDYRGALAAAAADESALTEAPAVLIATSVVWRNAWKYAARAYRHVFWDIGTMLPNTLAVAAAEGWPASIVLGFADRPVARLLDIDPDREFIVALVPLGRGHPVPAPRSAAPLGLPVAPVSPREIAYPITGEAQRATELADPDHVRRWRAAPNLAAPAGPTGPTIPLPVVPPADWPRDPVEAIIRRRGSTRRFAQEPISLRALSIILSAATRPISSDVFGPAAIPLNELIVAVNAAQGLAPGIYRYWPDAHALEPRRALDEAASRELMTRLALDQELAGDAAVDFWWLTDLPRIMRHYGARGYRLAQLGAALVGGKCWFAAYACGLGATGLTFIDSEVPAALAMPDEAAVMFLLAIGTPAPRPDRR